MLRHTTPHHVCVAAWCLALCAPDSADRWWPVAAVDQLFSAVYGYQLPLRRLGLDSLRALLSEMEAEVRLVTCSGHPAAVGGAEVSSRPMDVVCVLPPEQGSWESTAPRSAGSFNRQLVRRVGRGAQFLTDWEPAPLLASSAPLNSLSTGPCSAPRLMGGTDEAAASGVTTLAAVELLPAATRCKVMATVEEVLRGQVAHLPPAFGA
jgi:hypothetical protein